MRLRSGERCERFGQFVVVLGVGKVRGHSGNKPNRSKLVWFLRGRIRVSSPSHDGAQQHACGQLVQAYCWRETSCAS